MSKIHSQSLGDKPQSQRSDVGPRASYKNINVCLWKCQKNVSHLSKAGSAIVLRYPNGSSCHWGSRKDYQCSSAAP